MLTAIFVTAFLFMCFYVVNKWERKAKKEMFDQGDLSMGNKYDFDEADIYR